MDNTKCQVYTIKGTQCKQKHKVGSPYCSLHEKKREETGPHGFAQEQLAIRQKFERFKQLKDFQDRRQAAESPQEMRAITNEETLAEAQMTVRHRNEIQDQRDAQQAEIHANGNRDPDQPARDRREIENISTQVVMYIGLLHRPNHWNIMVVRNQYLGIIARLAERIAGLLFLHQNNPTLTARLNAISTRIQTATDEFEAWALVEQDGGVVPGLEQQAPAGGRQRMGAVVMAVPNPNVLARFANDNQNVHTQLIVEQTKKNIAEILKIDVPPHYRWDRNKVSMTFKMVALSCSLSPKSMWQFTAMYCSDATIYDLEPGIFGKVVDGVWQFISQSPDKTDLKKILRSELRDNIGMCAQGNLSRVCNVLQGYLEGIKQKESVNVILGREFGKLVEIQDEHDRLDNGRRILKENNVPEIQWETWLEPLRA